MEVQRSTRHRSLGVHPKPQPTRTKRPSLGGRHQSAPLTALARKDHLHSLSSNPESRELEATRVTNSDNIVDSTRNNYPIINLIVIGKARVGKTTFIQNALDLTKVSFPGPASSKVSLDSIIYRVQLCEVHLDDIDIAKDPPIKWPSTTDHVASSSVDGVLCLYDITDEDSISGLPKPLYALNKSNLPVMLVACKADAPISEQEIGITFIERVRRSFPLVTFGESSSVAPDSAKRCLNVSLKATLAWQKLRASVAASSSQTDHSDLLRIRTTDFDHHTTSSIDPQTPLSDSEMLQDDLPSRTGRPNIAAPETPESYHHNNMVRAKIEESNMDGSGERTFLESDADSLDENSDHSNPPLELLTLKETTQTEGGEAGYTFAQLVDRLLQMPATKSDAKFVPAFLCLYRMFATPRQLLVAVIDRFWSTEQDDMVALMKVAELLRYLQVIALWTANYPGDFAEPSNRRLAISFAQELEQNKNFVPSARDIISNLLTIIMDDDRDWAYSANEEEESPASQRTTRSSILIDQTKDSGQQNDSDHSDFDKDIRRRSIRNSGTGSTTSSIIRSSTASSQSATNLFNLDNAREQSRLFTSIPHVPLSKTQWHYFMAIPNEELAQEITRMDWTMYSAIRARDFVRHLNLSSQQRARLRHADTIGMMVKHFNHLALFVSGMILLRDKPKHRAKVLEKFMDLAWKVRQQNNYNSLGAIVAGVTGPEIARLTQTHELVPNEVKKQFLRLTVLMSISRSHAAYRMAWENSFAERIPFVPLLRQDLTMAASANPTFIGEKINWKKFQIMGDVIVSIQRSHEQPYIFPERTARSQEITRLILETKVIDEAEDSADPRSELYDRSVQLEHNTHHESRKSLAGFGVKRTMTGWFQT